jgi:hypothetical protein
VGLGGGGRRRVRQRRGSAARRQSARVEDALGTSFGNRSAKTFLLSTPPDNEARDLSAEAGVALPLNMRITGTFATGHVDASTRMRDYTSNSAAKSNPFYPDLPSDTIDAQVDTTRYDLAFTGTPLRWLSFRAFARGYEYDNQTPVYTFPLYISRTPRSRPCPAAPSPTGGSGRGGIDLRLRVLPTLSLGGGLPEGDGRAHVPRGRQQRRDTVASTSDYCAARLADRPRRREWSDRTADDYDPKAYFQSFPSGVPPAQLRHARAQALRRRRPRASGLRDLRDHRPGAGWGIDAESRQRSDDYVDSDYGLVDQGWRNQLFGLTMKFNEPCEMRAENGTSS